MDSLIRFVNIDEQIQYETMRSLGMTRVQAVESILLGEI